MKIYIAKDENGANYLYRTKPKLQKDLISELNIWTSDGCSEVFASFPELKPCQCAVFELKEIVDGGFNPVKNDETV